MYRIALALFGIGLYAQAAGAGEAASECSDIKEDGARLACYDAIFGRLNVARANAIAPTAVGREKEFGLSPAAVQGSVPESITRVVASATRNAQSRLVITLDDGQVWTQVEPDTRAAVRPGEQVTISRAALGSFKLMTERGKSTRVRRLR